MFLEAGSETRPAAQPDGFFAFACRLAPGLLRPKSQAAGLRSAPGENQLTDSPGLGIPLIGFLGNGNVGMGQNETLVNLSIYQGSILGLPYF